MINIFKWFNQKRCKHNYMKHWCRRRGPYGGYVYQCTKCGKIEVIHDLPPGGGVKLPK